MDVSGIEYTVFRGPATYSTAREQCRSRGMALASVTSATIASGLQTQVMTVLSGTGYAGYWVGGSDAAKEGIWRWEDGSAWSYTNWYTGEPNNANSSEYCLQAIINPDPNIAGRWKDTACATTFPFVCGPPGERGALGGQQCPLCSRPKLTCMRPLPEC